MWGAATGVLALVGLLGPLPPLSAPRGVVPAGARVLWALGRTEGGRYPGD